MLIRFNLESEGLWVEENPPRAGKPTQAELIEELRKTRQRSAELEAVLEEVKQEEEE